MDASEATKVVMSRIKGLDPENASRIMGCILIQDQGEKEMIRLAFGPESLLLSHINQARACLGLSSCSSSTSLAISSSPKMMKLPNSPYPRQTSSPRLVLMPNSNGFLSSSSSPAFQRQQPFTYAAAVNGNGNGSNAGGGNCTSSGNTCGSPRLHFYSGGHTPVQEQLSFTDEMSPMVSPGGRSDSVGYPYGVEDLPSIPSPQPQPHPFHRRSSSVNDVAFLASLEDGGNGNGNGNGNHGLLWRPCVYFARGFCKNGSTCKFLHSDGDGLGEGIELGSPNKGASGFDDLLRMKALQSQRFALMASGGHPLENLRHDFSPISGASSSSRQIYLTFPADSTFKEDDVSDYFSTYGPVQDVRIPHQQKRMFGFVTFVYAETVKLILAKGNPHFVCDSRVLVKPYKEKGKIPERKQHLERAEYSGFLSPSGADAREHIDHPIGSRMLYSPQEMMLRRKLEASELQHAIELQSQRMMNLRLADLKIQHRNNHFLPSLGAGIPISSPRQSPSMMNQNITTTFDVFSPEDSEGFDDNQEAAKYTGPVDQRLVREEIEGSSDNYSSSIRLQHRNGDGSYLPESLEHVLPDNLFASPTKSAAEHHSVFSQATADDTTPVTNPPSNHNVVVLPGSSHRPTFNSYYNHLPRFPSGQEAVEM